MISYLNKLNETTIYVKYIIVALLLILIVGIIGFRWDFMKTIGIDIGIKKLIATSEGKFYGREIEELMNKIQRKQQGSKAFKKACKERNYYINKSVKELSYNKIKTIVVENIKDIKKNTKKNTKKRRRLRKQFRTKFQRWTYPLLIGG